MPKRKIKELAMNKSKLSTNENKCVECNQVTKIIHQHRFNNYKKVFNEYETLTNKNLITINDSLDDNDLYSLPIHKIDNYSIYSGECKHLIKIDSGLIECGKEIYLSGIVRPIYYDENINFQCKNNRNNGKNNDCDIRLPTIDIGPINEWWLTGFNSDEQLIIGIESCSANYILLKPAKQYAQFIENLIERFTLCKLIIEFLNANTNATIEELFAYLRVNEKLKNFNEDLIYTNAHFILTQISNYDDSNLNSSNEPILFETQCVQDLLKVSFGDHYLSSRKMINKKCTQSIRRIFARKDSRRVNNSDMLATSTPLVKNFFEVMFKEAIDKNHSNENNDDDEDDDDYSNNDKNEENIYNETAGINGSRDNMNNDNGYNKRTTVNLINKRYLLKEKRKRDQIKITWPSKSTYFDQFSRTFYYDRVKINSNLYKSGDFVITETGFGVGKLIFMLETQQKQQMAHIHWFCFGQDTILKETCDHQIIFMLYKCDNISIDSILRKINVKFDCNGIQVNKDNSNSDDQYNSLSNSYCDISNGGSNNNNKNNIDDSCDDSRNNYYNIEKNNCCYGEFLDEYICNMIYFKDTGSFEQIPAEAIKILNVTTTKTTINNPNFSAMNSGYTNNSISNMHSKAENKEKLCLNCEKIDKEKCENLIKLDNKLISCTNRDELKTYYKAFIYKNITYNLNDCVYIRCIDEKEINLANNSRQTYINNNDDNNVNIDYDETIYTEKYRKQFSTHIKGSLNDVQNRIRIAQIHSIYTINDHNENNDYNFNNNQCDSNENDLCENVKIDLTIFIYNDELEEFTNKNNDYNHQDEFNVNEIYLTNKHITVSYDDILKKCDVYSATKNFLHNEKNSFPNWFYVRNLYNYKEKTLITLTDEQLSMFANVSSIKYLNENASNIDENFLSKKKLSSLDLFAGCGGLSFGFHNTNVIDEKRCWAIEKDHSAVSTYRENFPNTIVFEDDANYLLKLMINDNHNDIEETTINQNLPKPGEVDLILAGPPCQGFSGINRFSTRQYSLFKNSLIITLLSYIDHLKPKFVYIENVRNFLLFKKSMILKLTLSCLIKMNYQVRFSVLQAGSYGVPQTRRRMFIIAALIGNQLPKFPQPTHCFSARSCQFSLIIDKQRYSPPFNYDQIAYPVITVYDAISDLENLPFHNDNSNNTNNIIGDDSDLTVNKIDFKRRKTFYQQILQANNNNNDDNKIKNHECKAISLLTQARINHIPIGEGNDWRDLPNIEMQLADDLKLNKLLYQYNDQKLNGARKGVCRCATDENNCNANESRQENTLIPWCLVHTANRNYQWAGLYGRLFMNGYFPTIVTNPEPISKQGRVLHPTKNRIISVRESARAQSFPDTFIFSGTVQDAYRQIGNAVPPLLAYSIAMELSRSYYSFPLTDERSAKKIFSSSASK